MFLDKTGTHLHESKLVDIIRQPCKVVYFHALQVSGRVAGKPRSTFPYHYLVCQIDLTLTSIFQRVCPVDEDLSFSRKEHAG